MEAPARLCQRILFNLSRGADKIALFDLRNLGVDSEGFLAAIKPTFDGLEPDTYLVKKREIAFLRRAYENDSEALRLLNDFHDEYYYGAATPPQVQPLVDRLKPSEAAKFSKLSIPNRFRRMSKFTIEKKPEQAPEILDVADSSFHQDRLADESDVRKKTRKFARSSEEFRNSPLIRQLLLRVFETVQEATEGSAKKVEITLHQMSIVAADGRTATNSPEGIHQDGMDFIVSALVIERRNVKGGKSIIFEPDKISKILSVELQEGQGIFQSDHGSNLWHAATRIKQKDRSKPAIRNIIGLDITILEYEQAMSKPKLNIEIEPGLYAVSQLPPDSPIPAWATQGRPFNIESNSDEVSIVSLQEYVPPGVKSEKNWVCLKIKGPLDLNSVGILVSMLNPLVEGGIATYAKPTFHTDYVLVKEANLQKALRILEAEGHSVSQ